MSPAQQHLKSSPSFVARFAGGIFALTMGTAAGPAQATPGTSVFPNVACRDLATTPNKVWVHPPGTSAVVYVFTVEQSVANGFPACNTVPWSTTIRTDDCPDGITGIRTDDCPDGVWNPAWGAYIGWQEVCPNP